MPSKAKIIITVAAVLVAVVGYWAWSRAGAAETKKGGKGSQEVPVKTTTVDQKSIPVEIRAIGQVEASSTVNVNPQVGGQITRIDFKEGDVVHKGQVLFNIDPRVSQTDVAQAEANYQKAVASVSQARANLAKDQATARNAAAEEVRYRQLVKSGVVSDSQYDTVKTTLETASATVKADQDAVSSEQKAADAQKAALDASKVQLGFTTITSPVDGKTGQLGVHQGDVVNESGGTPLVVIAVVAPIYVTFTVPEDDFVKLKAAMTGGGIGVKAAPAADPGAVVDGTLSFVDNTVDTSTGTIRLKATFVNNDQRLWPGQFVNVTVTLGTQDNAVVVPKVAVQTGQQGTFVFVVKDDSTAEMRPVQVERTADDLSVISSGLQKGERVITDGQLRVAPGAKVTEGTGNGSGGPGGPGSGAAGTGGDAGGQQTPGGAPSGAAPAGGGGGQGAAATPAGRGSNP